VSIAFGKIREAVYVSLSLLEFIPRLSLFNTLFHKRITFGIL
jgi:hypothetical protein